LAQLRYIGYNEAITQEVLQLVSRAAVPAGVVLGLESSVEPATLSGVVNIRIKPGLLSMADGMLAAESEDVLVPLAVQSSDAGLQYTLTLIAEKGTGLGRLDDPIEYKIVPGKFYASQMPQVVGRLRMPLAFITKAATGTTAASFSTVDLGDRSVLNKTLTLHAPIANLRTAAGVQPQVVFDATVAHFTHTLLVSSIDTEVKYYLPLDLDANHQLLAVTFVGRSNLAAGVTQKVKVESLVMGATLSDNLQFHGSTFVPQAVVYPVGSPTLRDVLEITAHNYNTSGEISGTSTAFELQQVVVTTRRIFA
jgi:hypothetical protein